MRDKFIKKDGGDYIIPSKYLTEKMINKIIEYAEKVELDKQLNLERLSRDVGHLNKIKYKLWSDKNLSKKVSLKNLPEEVLIMIKKASQSSNKFSNIAKNVIRFGSVSYKQYTVCVQIISNGRNKNNFSEGDQEYFDEINPYYKGTSF